MQQVMSRPEPQMPRGNGKPQLQKLLIVVLTLFAFSGLLIGFTVGAYTRAPHTSQLVTKNSTGAVVSQVATPSPTAGIDIMAIGVGCPNITAVTLSEMADGITSYTFTAQVVDKSLGNDPSPCGTGKALFAPDLICKIWLTKDAASLKKALPADALKPGNLPGATFPGEEPNALVFDGSTTPQAQPCSQTGATSWTYKLSPTLKSGTYYLAVISDWQGKRYNWRWVAITVSGQ